MPQTALITGCSSGIGRATARAFVEDDWTVYATARNPDEMTELDEAGAITARLDVTSTDEVDAIVERIIDEQGQVDCLVNNAGFGQTGPIEDVPVEKVREQYEVNTFGPHRLMRAVLPHMRDRGTGTIITVSSMNDRLPFAGSGVYSGSKSALATASKVVRQEVERFGVDVVIVEPSFVATDFYDRMLEELDDLNHTPAYTDLYEVLEQLQAVEGGGPGIVPPETAAETILAAANSDSPKRRYEIGAPARAGRLIASVLPESWHSPALRIGVRLATSTLAQRILDWWNAHHQKTSKHDS